MKTNVWTDINSAASTTEVANTSLTIFPEAFPVYLPPELDACRHPDEYDGEDVFQFHEYQRQVEGRCLVHALSNACHCGEVFTIEGARDTTVAKTSKPQLTGETGPNSDTSKWFNTSVMLELLEQQGLKDDCVEYSTNRRTIFASERAKDKDTKEYHTQTLNGQPMPDLARQITTAAVLYDRGHFVAITNLHTAYYKKWPSDLACDWGGCLLDAADDLVLEQMHGHVEELLKTGWQNFDSGARPIFQRYDETKEEPVLDPFRKQYRHDNIDGLQAAMTRVVQTFYGNHVANDLRVWAPTPDDARSGDVVGVNAHSLLRKGKGQMYNALERQAAHTDCPPEGVGPHLNDPDEEAVWHSNIGVNTDSCIVTGEEPSKLWVFVRKEWKLLHLPERSFLFFPGNLEHAGAYFKHNNAVLHFYMGGSDLDSAWRIHGWDITDTTSFRFKDTDDSDGEGSEGGDSEGDGSEGGDNQRAASGDDRSDGGDRKRGGGKSTSGGGKRRKSNSQSTLSQAMPKQTARADELKRKAQGATGDEPTRERRQRQGTLSQTMPAHVERAEELERTAASATADTALSTPFKQALRGAAADNNSDKRGSARKAPDVSPARAEAQNSAFESLNKHANAMQQRVHTQDGKAEVGTIVDLPIDRVDRPRLYATAITCVVLKVSDRDLFTLGTTDGYLPTTYTRSAFTLRRGMTAEHIGMYAAVEKFSKGKLEVSTMKQLIKADSATGMQSCAFEIDFAPHLPFELTAYFVLAPLILIIVCCWCDGRWTRLPQVQLQGQVRHDEVRMLPSPATLQ